MDMGKNSELGQIITRLIAKENLTQGEAYEVSASAASLAAKPVAGFSILFSMGAFL